jgi:hypothetical protein
MPVTDQKYDRFIDKFDLPPGETKHVVIAYWVSREEPYTDDTTIGICGPVAAGCGGNILRLPISDHILIIKLGVPDSRSNLIRFRLWIDTAARRLRAS